MRVSTLARSASTCRVSSEPISSRARARARERVTSLSPVPSKTRISEAESGRRFLTVISKKRHTPRGGTGVCMYLSRTRVAERALARTRGASGPLVRARLSLDHPAHNVCALYLTYARRARRSWIPVYAPPLSIADSWVHSPLGIGSRAVRDNLNGAGFAIVSRAISRPPAVQAGPHLRRSHRNV